MQDKITCTILQYPIIWNDKHKNFSFLEELFNAHKLYNQLVILPETFQTGFNMDVQLCVENSEGETKAWMEMMSQKYNSLILGSLLVKEQRKIYNRLYVITPHGLNVFYDKRHLFMKEQEVVKKGEKSMVFVWQGIKFKPLICFDLRFPLWSRQKVFSSKEFEYDALIYIANWPKKRIQHWKALLVARAIENQCYVFACNRTGISGDEIAHNGYSMIISPKGKIIKNSEEKKVDVLSYALNKEKLDNYRKQFPFYISADKFEML